MRSILVINGPNLNLLGRREPAVYGTTTLAELDAAVVGWGEELGLEIETFQSNHEGALIDRLHTTRADGVVLNAGAYTHTSYAIHDAISGVAIPTVEVHISNVRAREPWRRRSVTAPACVATIYGRGVAGYRWALRHLVARASWPFETVAYGEGPDRVGDLRLPEGHGPHPVVVTIHGGFWRDPWTRDTLDAVAVDLARRGYATWNPEYHRVGGGGGWPNTVDDVAAAVDAVATLAERYPLDPTRVVVSGHSAGGQLALWAAARRGFGPERRGAVPAVAPVGALALAPITDLVDAHRRGLGNGAVEDFLRRTPADGADRYDRTSPRALLPIGVPQRVVHGALDDEVPIEMSRDYVAAAGPEARLVELAGTDHYDLIDPRLPAWERCVAALTDLLAVGR